MSAEADCHGTEVLLEECFKNGPRPGSNTGRPEGPQPTVLTRSRRPTHSNGSDAQLGEHAMPRLPTVEGPLEVPHVAVGRNRREFIASLGRMADQVAHARWEVLEPGAIVRLAPARFEVERIVVEAIENGDTVRGQLIEDAIVDVGGIRSTQQFQDLLAETHQKSRQLVVTTQSSIDLDEGRQKGDAHMGVEVGDVDARLECAFDLGSQLRLDLVGFRPQQHIRDRSGEDPLLIEQGGDGRSTRHGPPPIARPLGRQGQVDPEVEFGVGAGPLGRFAEPRARDHDAAASRGPPGQRLEGTDVGGVTHSDVVGVDDGHPVAHFEPQALDQTAHGPSLPEPVTILP